MAPENLYFGALALIVAPSMGINPMAVLIAGLWAVGQPFYLMGLNENVADVAFDFVGLVGGTAIAAHDPQDRYLLTALTFAPMFATHASVLAGHTTPVDGWWIIYGLAFFQIGLMLSDNDWPRFRWFERKVFA